MKYKVAGCQLYWFENKLTVVVDRIIDRQHLPLRRTYTANYSDGSKLISLVGHATELVMRLSLMQAYYFANKFK
jgi:hypothetical protein